MFKITSSLLDKIESKINFNPLEPYSKESAKSCGDTCHGNCDDQIKKKPH